MTQSTDGTESNISDSIDPEDDCWLAIIHKDVDKMAYTVLKWKKEFLANGENIELWCLLLQLPL